MKTRIALVLVLIISSIGTLFASEDEIIKFPVLMDSAFVWAKERAPIERVDEFLSPKNVSMRKNLMVVMVKMGDNIEEWVVTVNIDDEKRVDYIGLILRKGKSEYSKVLIRALALKFALEIKPYYFKQDGKFENDTRSEIYGVSTQKKVMYCLSCMPYSPKWGSAILDLTFMHGTDTKRMKQ